MKNNIGNPCTEASENLYQTEKKKIKKKMKIILSIKKDNTPPQNKESQENQTVHDSSKGKEYHVVKGMYKRESKLGNYPLKKIMTYCSHFRH